MVKVAVTGQKVWSDDASKAGDTRPQSITINLLRNGSKVDTAQVTPDDDDAWSLAFEDLDKYDDEGEEYTYTVKEELVEGYDGEVEPTGENVFTVTNTIHDRREDYQDISLTVHKKDPSDPSAKLVGAEFTLTRTDKDADPVVKTTGADGTVAFGFAEPGTWTLRETKAPAGYVLSDAVIQIVVGKDKLESVTYDKGNAVWSWLYSLLFEKPEVTDNVLEFEDAKTAVKVSKVDVADGKELAGARIQVIDKDGKVVDEWVSTGKSHEVTGLTTGEQYTLHEEVAPDGYTVAADTTFSVDESGKVTSTGTVTSDGTLLVEDTRITKPDKPTTPEKPSKKLVQTSDPLADWGTTALWTAMVGAALVAGGFMARGRREE